MSDKSSIRFRPAYASARGVALIIILSAIVLVSVIVLAFLTRSMSGRTLSFASASRYQADRVAKVGIETVLGDIHSEILAGSQVQVVGDTSIYTPLQDALIVPYRRATEVHPNIVKRSLADAPLWEGAAYSNPDAIESPVRAMADNNTATPARGGRYISPERWNAPLLLGDGDPLPTGFTAPDWILLTRKGPIADASNSPVLANMISDAAANEDFVLGRFAYIVYNVGGLLDVNVAGYPGGISGDFTSTRGLLPHVNLGTIPGVLNAASIVDWRNEGSNATANGYQNYVFNNPSGFTTVATGDQTFVGRQDLIRYAKANGTQLEPDALQFLTTFTRELSAPSYTPSSTRPVVGANDDDFNPSLISTRVTTGFTRADGSVAAVGEPLIKKRFSLSRLALLTPTSTATTSDLIYQHFGLTRSAAGAPWLYRNGATAILTLAEVAAAGREPDFFELLQAAILHGSLGQERQYGGTVYSDIASLDASTYYQVMQIGANLIDQYDADSYPVRISFDLATHGVPVSGVENLPYLTRVFFKDYVIPGDPKSEFGIWLQPEVWNPHANATTVAGQPSYFRFAAVGTTGGVLKSEFYGIEFPIPPRTFTGAGGIVFAPSTTHQQPTYINNSGIASSSNSDDVFDSGGPVSHLGICLGKVAVENVHLADPKMPFYITPTGQMQFELQYSTDQITWITYDRMRNVTTGVGVYADSRGLPASPFAFLVRSDPRSDRFGPLGWFYEGGAMPDGMTVRPAGNLPGVQINGLYPGLLADNLPSSTTRYADRDGVQRPADGRYASGSQPDGFPLTTNNLTSRPIILNRPFRSVAEMGYASRGMPWKHLDFFSTESADAALLDLFSVQETPSSGIVAGRVDLNSAPLEVLSALLSGTGDLVETNNTLSPAEADSYAQNLMTLRNTSPLMNRSELVSRWMGSFPTQVGRTVAKRQREASIRALAEVGNTRTWNLMIDVIGQSGRIAKNATRANEFIVEGERRYWMHVAIDRYTGEVVSSELELVEE